MKPDGAAAGSDGAVGFFRAFFGVCSGTALFDRLLAQPLWRVFVHLVVMAFFVACGVTLIRAGQVKQEITPLLRTFESEFGGFSVRPSGVFPEKAPEKARSLPLWPNGGVVYAPTAEALSAALPSGWNGALLWTPSVIALAARDKEQFYYMTPKREFPYFGNSGMADRATLFGRLEKFPAGLTVEAAEKLDLRRMATAETIAGTTSLLFFIGLLLTAVLLELILTTVFSLVYRFIGVRPEGIVFRLGELFRIGVYAGFPALAVAGLFPAFDLPLFGFDQAYSLGLVMYMLVAITAVTRRRLKPAPQEENKNE